MINTLLCSGAAYCKLLLLNFQLSALCTLASSLMCHLVMYLPQRLDIAYWQLAVQ